MSDLCPCDRQQPYDICCGPYLRGEAQAPTAVALMRSRYTAYCKGDIDYLVATQHPTQRRPGDRTSLNRSVQTTTWLGLTILATSQGQSMDQAGTVEFVAVYQTDQVEQIHEKSRFVQQKGRWFYLDGDHLPPWHPPRQAPCWCGSGKKFKQCHGQR